jgi:hypothetical protein
MAPNSPESPNAPAEIQPPSVPQSHSGKGPKAHNPWRSAGEARSSFSVSAWFHGAQTPFLRCDYRSRILRFVQWNSVGFLLVCVMGFFWWAGDGSPLRIARTLVEDKAGYSPPLENGPQPSPEVENNTKASALRLPPDLEGTAVVYPREINGLVGADGSFRTNLSLIELASLLKVDPQVIAKNGSNNEIDPNAILFKVVTGRLSERAKDQALREREIQSQIGMPMSAVVDDWLLTELRFTLNALERPTEDEKSILDAISRSALLVVRQPGAKINAVPTSGGEQLSDFKFSAGYLPLEPSPDRGDAPGDTNPRAR